jgi:uridine kinase
VKVWVDTPRDECLRRGLERDGQAAEAAWREWQAAEDRYAARDHPELAADLIVSGVGGRPWTGLGRPDKSQEP